MIGHDIGHEIDEIGQSSIGFCGAFMVPLWCLYGDFGKLGNWEVPGREREA